MKATALFITLVIVSVVAYGSNITVEKSGKGPDVIIITGLGGATPWNEVMRNLSMNHTCHLISIKGLNGEKNPDLPDFQSDELNEYKQSLTQD